MRDHGHHLEGLFRLVDKFLFSFVPLLWSYLPYRHILALPFICLTFPDLFYLVASHPQWEIKSAFDVTLQDSMWPGSYLHLSHYLSRTARSHLKAWAYSSFYLECSFSSSFKATSPRSLLCRWFFSPSLLSKPSTWSHHLFYFLSRIYTVIFLFIYLFVISVNKQNINFKMAGISDINGCIFGTWNISWHKVITQKICWMK